MTYNNECSLEVDNCQSGNNVEIEYSGECMEKLCSRTEFQCERPDMKT